MLLPGRASRQGEGGAPMMARNASVPGTAAAAASGSQPTVSRAALKSSAPLQGETGANAEVERLRQSRAGLGRASSSSLPLGCPSVSCPACQQSDTPLPQTPHPLDIKGCGQRAGAEQRCQARLGGGGHARLHRVGRQQHRHGPLLLVLQQVQLVLLAQLLLQSQAVCGGAVESASACLTDGTP